MILPSIQRTKPKFHLLLLSGIALFQYFDIQSASAVFQPRLSFFERLSPKRLLQFPRRVIKIKSNIHQEVVPGSLSSMGHYHEIALPRKGSRFDWNLHSLLFLSLASQSSAFADCRAEPIYQSSDYVGCEVRIDDLIPRTVNLPAEECLKYCEQNYVDYSIRKNVSDLVKGANKTLAEEVLSSDDSSPVTWLGGGFSGQVFVRGDDAIKIPNVYSMNGVSSICQEFQAEVQLKQKVLDTYQSLISAGVDLSPLLLIDPGQYQEKSLVPEELSSFRVTTCWMSMKRIWLDDETKSREKNRRRLYEGALTSKMEERIKAIAQLYSIHLIGAGLRIPMDLELVVGSVGSGEQRRDVVSLIDYGNVRLWEASTFSLSDSIDELKEQIPEPNSGEKFEIFKKSFLDTANTLGKAELGLRVMNSIEGSR